MNCRQQAVAIQIVLKMIKIDAKEHEKLAELYGMYKECRNLYGNIAIYDTQDEAITNEAAEFRGTYATT